MKYLKITLLVSIFWVTCHFFLGSNSQASQASVQWTMDPPIETVRPLGHEPASITVKALDKAGKPLKNAQIHLTLFAPSSTPWFSTDFPWVEGSQLLDMTQNTATGEIKFQQTFPIRGNYRLQAQVTPILSHTFEPFEQNLSWAIAEKEIRYRNYGLLLALLVLIGFLGGWIIAAGGKLEEGEIAPRQVRLLLSSMTIIAIAVLLFINITAEAGSSHTEHPHSTGSVNQHSSLLNTQKNGDLTLELQGEDNAIVGQLNAYTVTVKSTGNSPAIADQTIYIQTKQLEHNQITFATQTTTNADGKFQWQQQFFDGSPHQLTVSLLKSQTELKKPLQVEKEISVEALEPPLWRRLISLGYMVFVLSLGFGLGFIVRQRWQVS